jgi:hypothetical protein
MDSPGQMGTPPSEGKRTVGLWSRVEADPPLVASIPAASTPWAYAVAARTTRSSSPESMSSQTASMSRWISRSFSMVGTRLRTNS